MTTATQPTYEYEIVGANEQFMYVRDKEVCLEGSAGTGKSITCLSKLHILCSKYPNLRVLVAREVKADIAQSIKITFEQKVLPPGWLGTLIKWRQTEQEYRYPNKAIIALEGLDRTSKVMSTEWDMIYVNEMKETNEEKWQDLVSRLRNNRMPYQQIIGDTNPDSPLHWIKLRENKGLLTLIKSRHIDNPSMFNQKTQTWTAYGKDYMSTLDRLTGVQRKRLRDGEWVSAEGMVIDTWNEAENVTELAEYQPDNGTVIWGVDDGYSGEVDEKTGMYTASSHPRVFLWAQYRPNGQLCIFDEHHGVHKLSHMHIDEVLKMPYPAPVVAVVDKSAAELKAEIIGHDITVWNGANSVAESIKILRKWVGADENGFRRLIVHPRCKLLRSEMGMYSYRKGTEEPLKQFDHACLAPDTLVSTSVGLKPIQNITKDDFVLTRNGYKKVLGAGITSYSEQIYCLELSNNLQLLATKHHLIYVDKEGFIPLQSLKTGDIISCVTQNINNGEYNSCQPELPKKWKLFYTKGLFLEGILSQTIILAKTTIAPTLPIFKTGWELCTGRYGKIVTAQYPKIATSITKTITPITMTLAILSAFLRMTTYPIMGIIYQKTQGSNKNKTLIKSALLQAHGTSQRRVGHGTEKTLKKRYGVNRLMTSCVRIAKRFLHLQPIINSSAPTIVNPPTEENKVKTWSKEAAITAKKILQSTNTPQNDVVPVTAKRITSVGKSKVYNLTVEGEPEFYANGVLVHNCDVVRYLCDAITRMGGI